MDLLNRRTSTSSRRGTLIPGGGRRNPYGSGAGNDPAIVSTRPPVAKTQLLAEFRAHEEEMAARVLQRAARGFLGRKFVVRLLQQVYRRQYDPIEKQYYYVNTSTNETTWEKPRALQLFMDEDADVPVLSRASELSISDASRRIQRAARALIAKRAVHKLVRENYMKLFNSETKTYYYLNTRTGDTSSAKPLFLGKDSDDLPVETFLFRKAVCKVSSRTNLYGSGVLGFFGTQSGSKTDAKPWLCLLSDAKTLPDLETASTAHVLCNFTPEGSVVPFQITLRPAKFFASIAVDEQRDKHQKPQPSSASAAKFALCAVDREAFDTVAGSNIEPLRFVMDDRKMGCAVAISGGSVQLNDTVEVVGHPHGKPRVIHTRKIVKMLPHSIAPVKLQYDREMESGASGCAVFTRAGKLLGLQHFTPLKEPSPSEFYYIHPILESASKLVTPPEPFLLTTCLSAHEVQVCWSIVRWFKPLPGLAVEYELEICRHEAQQLRKSIDVFERVYRGPYKSKYIGKLQCGTLYSVRVRAFNAVTKSKWSHVLKFMTLPEPSLAWRITKYCTSVKEACARMRGQARDPEAQYRAVQWMVRHLDQTLGEHVQQGPAEAVEKEFVGANAVDLVLETIAEKLPDDERLALIALRLLTTLTKLQGRVQSLLSQVRRLEIVLRVLHHHLPTLNPTDGEAKPIDHEAPTPETVDESAVIDSTSESEQGMAVVLASVALLGFILDGDNASAQQAAQAVDVVPMLLSLMDADSQHGLLSHAPFVAECVFLFARYTHNHSHSGKWQLVDAQGLRVLRDVLEEHAAGSSSTIPYWTLITLGNVAYGCDDASREQLEVITNDLGLIMSICRARMLFLVRVNELELSIVAAQREFTRLAASVMGDEMRNEMDACEHEIQTMTLALQDLRDNGDVAHAGDFALRYLLTEEQRRVQQASQRLMKKFLLRKSSMAFAKWVDFTVFERNCAIFRDFVTTVRHRQLSAAFRKWEGVMREWRKHHKSVVHAMVAGSGLAMDLNKKKRERYRMLVLQK